jgi:hypothetical protein
MKCDRARSGVLLQSFALSETTGDTAGTGHLTQREGGSFRDKEKNHEVLFGLTKSGLKIYWKQIQILNCDIHSRILLFDLCIA